MMDEARSRFFRGRSLLVLSLVFFVSSSSAFAGDRAICAADLKSLTAAPVPCALKAMLSADQLADGQLLLVNLTLPEGVATADVWAEFEDSRIPLYPISEPASRDYQAVVGIPFNHARGATAVVVHAGPKQAVLPFTIIDGQYRSEVLRVPPRTIDPTPRELARIKKEAAEIGELYRTITPQKFWTGPFVLPLSTRITSEYGTKRVYNGQMQSYHQGIDLKAKMNTPIRAAAAGRVVLSKNLFLTGYTVLLDHGFGVYTVYAHMNKLRVRKGQLVRSGTIVGLSGMTGRSSGPHLHFGAVVHRVKVNPVELVRVLK